MKKVDTRKIQILKYIVEGFLQTGELTGSQSLLEKYNLGVSSATIRNDMAALERMGLILQPYNSAGRLPTHKGIRIFIDYLMEDLPVIFIEQQQEDTFVNDAHMKIDEYIYRLVSCLTHSTKEIAFACIPSEKLLCYLGLSRIFEERAENDKQEFVRIIQFLENKQQVLTTLQELPLNSKVSIFIDDEHLNPLLLHSTLLVKKITLKGHEGYLGIIGSLKMDYAFNIAALRQIL